MKLKKLYSSREVAAITGLSARQLQWWDQRRIFSSSIPSHKTERGGYTERRYTPIDLLELMVLADLRRRGFTVPRLRRLLSVLRSRFKVRLYEAIEGGGPITLYIDGDKIYARTVDGDLFNVLEQPNQPLLMVGEQVRSASSPSANDRHVDARRVARRSVDAVRRLREVLVPRLEDGLRVDLRIAIDHREPRALHLHHDAVPLAERVVLGVQAERVFLHLPGTMADGFSMPLR